jgi:vacuolar iron transporter family protein
MIHQEEHFQGNDMVRDVVIGMADGLTVPFALAAGISGAVNAVHIVVTAGIAEIAAGSVAMGLGGYLAARSEVEHYHSELKREEQEIVDVPHVEEREIADLFKAYGLTDEEVDPVVVGLRRNPKAWRDFMMKFELGLEEPDPKRALQCAATIAISYVVGGLVPLAPYMILNDSKTALGWSIVVTLIALAVFGFVKGHFTGVSRFRSGLQTVVVGGLAAAVAFYLARLFS